jgi:putative transposase
MPRKRRIAPAGQTFHIINRGNEGRQLFFEAADYQRFLDLLVKGRHRYPIRIYSYCLIVNHFHFEIGSDRDGVISRYMQWVTSRYASDLRVRTATLGEGHIYQARFWSDPIENDLHFLNVQRYIEANPLEAKLVKRAEDWEWSSLWERTTRNRRILDESPVVLPANWIETVNMIDPPIRSGSDPDRQPAATSGPDRGQTPPKTSR